MTLSRSASRKLALPPTSQDSFPSLSRATSSSPSPSPSPLASLFTPLTSSQVPTPPSPEPENPSKKGRIYKGSRSEDLYSFLDPFSPPPSFAEFQDSSFAIQEYITCLIRRDPSDLEVICRVPTTSLVEDWEGEHEEKEMEDEGMEVEDVDESLWIYEHLRYTVHRRLVIDSTPWISSLSSTCTCTTMNASSWYFICAAHSSSPQTPSGSCSALSYISHVSDGTSALLNSSRYFPSRLSIDGEEQRGLLNAVARRIYRSFAHCYFEHSEMFEELESETWVVRRLTELNKRFGMIDQEGLIIPDLDLCEEEEEEEGRDTRKEDEEDDNEENEGGIRLVDSPEELEEEEGGE